jgi:PAS domain S-box-containing protein
MDAGMPADAVRELQQERDHLLLLHEALADVERASSMERRLRVFVDAIRRIGFGRVTLTLRDSELNAREIVTAGLSEDEDSLLRESPVPGTVWRRRMLELERFRVSGSYYLPGRDPWVAQEFGGSLPSRLSPGDDPDWSPADTLLVPIRNPSGAMVATLFLDDPSDRSRPSISRVRTVELFAQQMAAMLEHASLMELAQHRARRLQQLHEIGSLLARSLDEETILRSLALRIQAVLPVSVVVIFSMESEGVPWPRALYRDSVPQDEMFTSSALRSLAALSARTQRPAREGSAYAVPAVIGPRTVGVIVVDGINGAALDADDADMLQTIGAQAAAAMSNAALYSESLRQRRQTEALADVARAVGESLEIDRVLLLILRHATALLRTDGATVSLLRGDTLEVTSGVGVGTPLIGTRLALHGTMSGRAVRSATSIIRDDVHDDPDEFAPSIAASQVRNTIIVPLLTVAGPVGALAVFNRAAPFTEADADILQRLADQVAVAVVNARLFQEVAEATREWAVAFDSIGSGMVLLDKRGRIQRTNAQARRLMDTAEDEAVLGRDFHRALFGDESPCEQCIHLTAIAEKVVKRGTHDDKVRGRVFEITAAPHPLGGAVVTFDDVTEHRSLAERYRRVVETSRDAIVITDRERRIVFANPAAVEMLARGPDVVGTLGEVAVPETERGTVREYEDRALAGAPQNYEGIVVRPDGDRRVVAIATAPLRELDEVTGIVASMRDVTDERRARDAVAESERRYRNLFESASDAFYTLDVNGVFTSANRATCEMTGRELEALLGTDSLLLFDEREAGFVTAQLERAIAGSAVRYECQLHRPSGERRTLSVTNTPISHGDTIVGVLGVARDVTDARARAAALERSESRYTRLVESASDAIFTVDQDGRFTAVNRALERAVGRERETLLGALFTDFIDTRDLPAAERLLRETFSGERSRGAVRYCHADGEVRQGSLITSPVIEDARIMGALGIMRDVTDEQRIAEQLLQQEKLVAVGQLVSGVAHELNNPLAAVIAFAQLLLASPVPLADEPRQAVQTIHREAQRAAKIVTNLLTFARQQPAERAAAQLNEIITDTLELRRYALRTAGVNVELSLDPNLPVTWADPSQLQQVVLNLLVNAEHALAAISGPRRIEIGTSHEGDQIVFSVSDNGPGIAPDQIDRIFNPFFTTKPVGQGTGLGLSISDGIVREHGGRITVDAIPGAGARFTVELPYVAPARMSPALGRPRIVDAEIARRMLVVDDEPAMRAAVAGFLKSIGHTVQVAANGVEARALLAASEYDVVLLDLRMPGLGGEALYRELCERDPRHAQRVVFVTGDLQSDTSHRFLAEAGRPVIGKPFQLDDLAAVLASVTS